MAKLEWSALEYEEKTQSPDWFWALGVIVVASSAASAIYENYFFAALIVLSGVLLGFFATKPPEIISYELNEKGFKVHSRLYPYENIKAFWIQTESQTNSLGEQLEIKPTLFIKSERLFMPIMSIPITVEDAEDIESIMISKEIEKEEMKEHPSEKIMDFFGF